MIRKTFFLFIILFGIYALIIALNPGASAAQHQWQENVVKGEKYIYDTGDSMKNVIVGSSLANRIVGDSLSMFYNLAFSGQSALDGLEIIEHIKKLPKNIFLEMNTVFNAPSKEFLESLFTPLSLNIKKYCIAMRSDKQPLAFIFPAIQNIISKKDKSLNKFEALPLDSMQQKIFDKVLQLQVAKYSHIPTPDSVTKQFLLLKQYVTNFKAKGVNIVFFELPVNKFLIDLPYPKFIRSKFYEYFPADKNNYINIPANANYTTTDGLHLKDDEAATYTSYFKKESNKYYPSLLGK